MADTQQVLLVGGSDADAARIGEVLRAAGRACEVVRATGPADAARHLASRPHLLCLIVSLDEGVAAAPAWRRLLDEAGVEAPLFALGELSQEPAIARWLAEGAHDWLFRPHLAGLAAVLVRLEREHAEAAAREAAERRWREGTSELVGLARSPRFRGDDLKAALAEIDEAAVRGVQAARCGVWMFDEQGTTITQVDVFDARTRAHSSGRRLSITDHRPYFEALRSQRLLSVPDVTLDPRTRSLVPTSFGPAGIGATIDVALRLRGELVGALCLEHVGGPRRWHPGEESFAGALADLVSLALEGAERYRAETALLESQRRFKDLFEHSNDSIVLYRVEPGGQVICEDMNPASELISGLKRQTTIGKSATEVLQPLAAQRLEGRWAQAIRARATIVFEHELPLPAGNRWVNTALVPLMDDTGGVYRLAAISRDVTQAREAEALQRSLEAQMAESQKNEALARLASHIAHDVNNLLTVIVAHAQRLQGQPGKASEVAQAILQATGRGRELTQQVLTFGRRRPPERKPLELGPLVHETLKLLEPTAGGITLREVVAPRVPRVMADAGQLHQVLTNLCTNALQAMPSGNGTLTVTLETADVDFAFASRHPPLQAGHWVRLTVTDTGVGMDETTARRIFEPFFSTRLDGSGNGLGLAVVQSIVQGHEGAVVVDSEPARGTAFHVYLRSVPEELSRPGAGQHLMLVDDHPGMARVSARLLETLGYRTTVFDDPREALKAFRATPTGFDAVLTDLSMPQMSGEDFTRSLRELRPEVPVIVSSGMASELDDAARQRLRINAVLVKPWRLEEAVAALQRVLG
jgi:PAS domain S-box-containing protein